MCETNNEGLFVATMKDLNDAENVQILWVFYENSVENI